VSDPPRHPAIQRRSIPPLPVNQQNGIGIASRARCTPVAVASSIPWCERQLDSSSSAASAGHRPTPPLTISPPRYQADANSRSQAGRGKLAESTETTGAGAKRLAEKGRRIKP
jgi:hypothetical protein